MGKPTLRQRLRDLEELLEITKLEGREQAALAAQKERGYELQLGDLRRENFQQEQMRVAAQNGLTPYVYAIQALNRWLAERPELARQMQEIMERLGLWGVEVGYDPQKDLALSIISPSRFHTQRKGSGQKCFQ